MRVMCFAPRFEAPRFDEVKLAAPRPGGCDLGHGARGVPTCLRMQEDEPHTRPEITAALARGVTRLLWDHGLASLLEVPLANGRRADVMGLTARGDLWIVETKSCVEDFTVDLKWPDYRDYCDLFYFAVTDAFPQELIPEDVGLIVADQFGGAIVRDAPLQPLAGARRKAVTLLVARLAAQRLAVTPPD